MFLALRHRFLSQKIINACGTGMHNGALYEHLWLWEVTISELGTKLRGGGGGGGVLLMKSGTGIICSGWVGGYTALCQKLGVKTYWFPVKVQWPYNCLTYLDNNNYCYNDNYRAFGKEWILISPMGSEGDFLVQHLLFAPPMLNVTHFVFANLM